MEKKLRILWNAKDSPHMHSGYGIITHYLTSLLAKHYGKQNVIIMAPVYQKDHSDFYKGMLVLPGTSFDFCEQLIEAHYTKHGCNLLLIVGDLWPICMRGIVPKLAAAGKINWIQWAPVDWLQPWPPYIVEGLKHCHKIIPFSKWAENEFKSQSLQNVAPAIWLGLNTQLWKPYDEPFEKTMRSIGFEPWPTYNMLIVAANQSRKYYPEHLMGIKIFRDRHPEIPIRLYIHSVPRAGDNRDLVADCAYFGLDDITHLPDDYEYLCGNYSEWDMVRIFASASVCLCAAFEGFGLAITQSQAVGTPVITLNSGVSQELTHSGILIPPKTWDMEMDNLMKPVPNEIAIADALEEIYPKGPDKRRWASGVKFAQEQLPWDKIAEQWYKLLDEIAETLPESCAAPPEPSAKLERRTKEVFTIV